MSALGLGLAVFAGVVSGLLFGAYPEIDLWASGLFFDRTGDTFPASHSVTFALLRSVNIYLFAGVLTGFCIFFAAAAFGASAASKREAAARAFWLLALTAIIGPGLIVNGLLKEQWGRPRPGAVAQFNADAENSFTPWWRTDGGCKSNCSFVAGEASIAFWLLAPATLIRRRRSRRTAYAAVFAVASLAGLLRIAVGGHFLSDVVFAGAIVFVVVWLTHRVIYRVPAFDAFFTGKREPKIASQASPAGAAG